MEKAFPTICLIILAAVNLANAQSLTLAADNFNRQGVEQINAKNYEAAADLFEHALRIEPGNAKIHFNLGTAFLYLKRLERSIGSFQQAIRLSRLMSKLTTNLALHIWRSERIDVPLRYSAKRFVSNPTILSHSTISDAHLFARDFNQSISPLKKARKLDANNIEIRINLGFALGQTKRLVEAITEIRAAVRLDPDDVQAQFLLGNLYLKVKDRRGAINQYAKIKQSNPELAEQLYQALINGKVVRVLR